MKQDHRHRREWQRHSRGLSWPGAGAAAATTGCCVLIALVLTRWLPPSSASLVFIVAVLISASTFGTWPGILAAGLSFLAYNFFFIEPLYTFTVADPQEVFALAIFLIVAAATGSIAGRLHERTSAARNYANRVEALHQLSVTLSGATTREAIVAAVAEELATAVDGESVILLHEGDGLATRSTFPGSQPLSQADLQAARRAYRRGETVPMPAAGHPGARFEFRVLETAKGPVGIAGLAPGTTTGLVATDAEPAVQAILRLGAIALERTLLAAEKVKAQEEATQERLRSALLSSLSHDLRTPLATIMGAASSLRQLSEKMTAEEQADLLRAIEEETARLARFVSNLLEMTRLQAGPIDMTRDWLDVADVLVPAAGRARLLHPAARIDVSFEPQLPLVRGEAQGLEQVLLNLIDNAARYSPAHGRIDIAAVGALGFIVITVTDEGPGIAQQQQERVFEKFYRLRRGDQGTPGTGLGLAICRAIIAAMGGTIHIESPIRDGRGTRVVLRLPVPPQPSLEDA